MTERVPHRHRLHGRLPYGAVTYTTTAKEPRLVRFKMTIWLFVLLGIFYLAAHILAWAATGFRVEG